MDSALCNSLAISDVIVFAITFGFFLFAIPLGFYYIKYWGSSFPNENEAMLAALITASAMVAYALISIMVEYGPQAITQTMTDKQCLPLYQERLDGL